MGEGGGGGGEVAEDKVRKDGARGVERSEMGGVGFVPGVVQGGQDGGGGGSAEEKMSFGVVGFAFCGMGLVGLDVVVE